MENCLETQDLIPMASFLVMKLRKHGGYLVAGSLPLIPSEKRSSSKGTGSTGVTGALDDE